MPRPLIIAEITKLIVTILIVGIGLVVSTQAQTEFNGKTIGTISIVFARGGTSTADEEEFRSVAANALGTTYSVVRVRDSIEALHRTGRIISVDVEALVTAT